MLEIKQHDKVVELCLTDTDNDNTLHPEVITHWNAALDEIEANGNNGALVITSQSEKVFSTGINLPWVTQQTDESFAAFIEDFDKLLLRLATFCMPTIGVLNGHTYAGGALIAAALDFRLMRADRGRFCFSEVNLKIPFTEVMTEIVRLLPSPQGAYELATTGAAWGGEECVQAGVVDQALGLEELRAAALAKAASIADKDRATFTRIKQDYRTKVSALARDRGVLPAKAAPTIKLPQL